VARIKVRSISAGIVASIREGAVTRIIIESSDAKHQYMCAKPKVRHGQKVKAGSVIGII